MTEVEKTLSKVNGQIIDYDMISNGTIFILVKSDKGNYSIRQAFRNIYGEYHGFKMVKMMRNVGREVATMEFEEIMSKIQ